MSDEPQVIRAFRCKQSFLSSGGRFDRGDLVYETHPAVASHPDMFEPDTLDTRELLEMPPELVAQARYKRFPVRSVPPSWWAHLNGGAA